MKPRRHDRLRRVVLWSIVAGSSWAMFTVKALAQSDSEKFSPNLTFPIPTVHFAPPLSGGSAYIAQYINGVYEYASSIASFIAGVIIVVGGFQYLVGQVAEGKKRIENGVAGLLIVLFAYTILNTVNPGLVAYNPIQLKQVAASTLDIIKFGGADMSEITNPAYAPPVPAVTGAPFDGTASYKVSLDGSIPPGIDLYGTSPRAQKPPPDSSGQPAPGMELPGTNADANTNGGGGGGGSDTNAQQQPGVSQEVKNTLIADLYSPTNEYGVQVKGTSPVARAYSVCVGAPGNKYPVAASKDEVMKRAAAIVRVWIIESLQGAPQGKTDLGGQAGAVYIRGGGCSPGGGGGGNPELGFALNGYCNGSLSGCEQPYLASSNTNWLPPSVCDCNVGKCMKLQYIIDHPQTPQAKDDAQNQFTSNNCRLCTSNALLGSLRTAYDHCWGIPACQAGMIGGDCTGYALQVLRCALGPGWLNVGGDFNPSKGMSSHPNNATEAFRATKPVTVGAGTKNQKEIKDPQAWIDVMKKYGGPQFLDLYHGCMDCSGPHTFMYVGGMGLKTTSGQLIFWLEMGGGGVFDTRLQGSNLAEGVQGYGYVPAGPDGGGGGGIGIKLHFVPSIVTMSAYDGQMYYYRTVDKYMSAGLNQ